MKLTVFTPTFNRSDTLPRLYMSLLAQERGSFEWLIIDDGSTDGTTELVRSWQAEGKLRIRYIWQANQGKHVAHNKAVLAARGKYFVCIDSDDWMVEGAVSRLMACLDELPAEAAGLVFPRSQASVKAGGQEPPWPIPDAEIIDFSDIRMAWGFSGETTIVCDTERLREHPFPVFPGETYPFEDIAYLGMKGDLRFVARREPLVGFAYRDDGLTHAGFAKWLANPQGALAMLTKRYMVAGGYGASVAIRQRVKAELNRIGLLLALGRPILADSPCVPLTVLLALPGAAISRLRFGSVGGRGAQ